MVQLEGQKKSQRRLILSAIAGKVPESPNCMPVFISCRPTFFDGLNFPRIVQYQQTNRISGKEKKIYEWSFIIRDVTL